MTLSVLLLIALILFVIAATVPQQPLWNRLVAIGLAFLAAGVGALQLLGVG
jgi:hypothetical protein